MILINNKKALAIKAKLYEQAVTVVKNENNFLPLKNIDSLSFGSLSFGVEKGNKFQESLDQYADFEHFNSKSQNIYKFQFSVNRVQNDARKPDKN